MKRFISCWSYSSSLRLSLFGLGGGRDDQSKVEPPPLPPLQPFNTPSMLHNVNSAYRL